MRTSLIFGIVALTFGAMALGGALSDSPIVSGGFGLAAGIMGLAAGIINGRKTTMTTEYLGVKQVAERLGITSGGLLNLKLPEPDATIGRTRGWLPETIDEWNAQRPGRGVGGGRPRKNKA